MEKHQDLILELCTGEDWAEMEAKIRVAASLAASSRSLHAEFIEKVVDSIDAANPESLVATVELFRRSQSTDLTQALELEWKVGAALRRRNNFIEGVRSVLIDKDRKPQFVPATVAGVNVGKWRDLLRG